MVRPLVRPLVPVQNLERIRLHRTFQVEFSPPITPRAPAHHTQLLQHSTPCTSAHLGLEPIHDHGGAHTLSVNTTMDIVRPILVHCDLGMHDVLLHVV